MGSAGLVSFVRGEGDEREGQGRGRTVGDDDACAEGYGLLGDRIRQVVGEQHPRLRGRLIRRLHIVEQQPDIIPRPIRKLLRKPFIPSANLDHHQTHGRKPYSSCIDLTTSCVNAGDRAVTAVRELVLDMVHRRARGGRDGVRRGRTAETRRAGLARVARLRALGAVMSGFSQGCCRWSPRSDWI